MLHRTPDGRRRLWTLEFVVATSTNFLLNLVFYLLMATMALYAMERFAVEGAAAGLAASIFVLGALVSRLIATRLIESVGNFRVFLTGAVLAVVVAMSYAWAAPIWTLFAVRLLHGLAFGLSHSAVGSIAQMLLPSHRRGEGIGYFSTAATLGTALGPLLAVWTVSLAGYPILFLGVTIVQVLVAVSALWFRRLPRQPPERSGQAKRSDEEASRRSTGASLSASPDARTGQWDLFSRLLPIGSIAFVQSLAYASIVAFIGTHTVSQGLGNMSGLFFLVYAAAVILVRLVAGRVTDRRGASSVYYPALVLYVLGLVLVAISNTPVVLLVGAVALGFGYGSLLPTGQTVAMNVTPEGHKGASFAWYFLFVDLGFGVGPVLLGGLVGAWGTTVTFLASSALVVCVGVMFATLIPDRYKRVG